MRLPIHGRGTPDNPANRFEALAIERDEWSDPDDPLPRTRLLIDHSRSIITRNDSPDVGFETSINPYRGCEHGCSYCMSGDTPILMRDGRWKRMDALLVGDEIIGTRRDGWYRRYAATRVVDHWMTRKHAFRIILEDGTQLVASGDHRFLTLRGWKYVRGEQQGKDRRPHLTTNDKLMGFGSCGEAPNKNREYRRGYICGMVRGDGLVGHWSYDRPGRKNGDQHQFRLALKDTEALDRTERYLDHFGVKVGRFTFSKATDRRSEMQAIRTHARDAVKRVEELISWPRASDSHWRRGFLAGIFDAEGSYSGGILRVSNTDSEIVDQLLASLSDLRLPTTVEVRKRNKGRPITVVRMLGGIPNHMRFFRSVEPAIIRKCRLDGPAIKSSARLGVVSIEPLPKPMTLYDVTTGTGDFIADGVVSHNCYARPGHEYLGFSAGLDFETNILVKPDAPELIREELSRPGWKPQTIVMSGVTDPYQPAEKRLGITRGCLEALAEFRNPVAIITKSNLVTRDADLLAQLAEDDAAAVAVSITTLDRKLQSVMEPRAAAPRRRLAAIRRLAEAGVPVRVMVAPVVPGLTDHEMPSILEAAAEAGASGAGYIMLRLPFGVSDLFIAWLERHFPDRRDKVVSRIRDLRDGRVNDPRYGTRMRGEGPFAEQVSQMFAVSCRRFGLDRERRALSIAAFRRPGGRQMELFAS